MTGASDDTTSDTSEDAPRHPRLQSFLFVAFFVTSVLALLTGYRYAIDTEANDRYLFVVATNTAWVLDKVGYNASMENARGNRMSPQEVRAHLVAFERGDLHPTPEEIAAQSSEPVGEWELYRMRAEQARLQGYNRAIGPQVNFVLSPNLSMRLEEVEVELQDARATGADVATLEAEERELMAKIQEKRQKSEADRAYVFIFNLVPECGAIEVMAIFFAAVVAFPTSWKKRAIGLIAGVPTMYLLNIFRVSCLAIIGALDSGGKWFNFSHVYVWQAVYIVFVVAVWLAWVEYVVKERPIGEGIRQLLHRLTPRGRRRRSILAFCLKFFLVAPILTIAWWWTIPYHGMVLVQLSGFILKTFLGVPIVAGTIIPEGIFNTGSMLQFVLPDREPALPIAQLVTNVPPYLALVFATSGLTMWRRLRIALYGVGILVAGHIAFIVIVLRWQETLQHASEIPVATMQFFLTLPFLLWIVFAYWDRIVRGRDNGNGVDSEDEPAPMSADE